MTVQEAITKIAAYVSLEDEKGLEAQDSWSNELDAAYEFLALAAGVDSFWLSEYPVSETDTVISLSEAYEDEMASAVEYSEEDSDWAAAEWTSEF